MDIFSIFIRRNYWIRENFGLTVFDGFTRFGSLEFEFLIGKFSCACQFVKFAAALTKQLMRKIS